MTGTRDHYFRSACGVVHTCGAQPEKLGQDDLPGYSDEAERRCKGSASWQKVETAGAGFLFEVTLARPRRSRGCAGSGSSL
ncbi:MAG: hypothetical protein U0414_21885 [Polyangiaceae bacterium]